MVGWAKGGARPLGRTSEGEQGGPRARGLWGGPARSGAGGWPGGPLARLGRPGEKEGACWAVSFFVLSFFFFLLFEFSCRLYKCTSKHNHHREIYTS
jgi:hypothetical protein